MPRFEPLHFGAASWREELAAVDFRDAAVFHLAARAHRGGAAEDFDRDNVQKTRALAEAAAAGGARRLVFLSSIKVNGEETRDRAFTPDDPPAPQDHYGRSKAAAEAAVVEVASRAGLAYTIVRAPLVYGARVRGNLAALLRLADSPIPLPFAGVRNRRSFVHVDDLARLLLACATTRRAAGRVYLACHREPVSTPRLLTLLRGTLGRAPRLFAVPAVLLDAAAAATGQRERMRRLTRSLECDPSRAERELDWIARVSIEQAVGDMVAAYRAEAP